MTSRSTVLLLLAFALGAACDDTVNSPPGGGGAGGGTGGEATTSGTAGGGGEGGADACGGFAGEQCEALEYCAYPDGSCGHDDGQGVCMPRPNGACPPDCPGVCGCDGQFYCSECSAHEAGVDLDPFASCSPAAP